MSDRISIADVRACAEHKTYLNWPNETLLALVEAVEAASEFMACGPDYGGQGYGGDEFTEYMEHFDAADDQIRQALARFDFGDTE